MGNLRLEIIQLLRDRAFIGSMLLLLILMISAAFNTYLYLESKAEQIAYQQEIVQKADAGLIAKIDSLNLGLASYKESYTLPTNGVRLTYNNHRITWLPLKPFALLSIGQGDLFSNYKKVVLYFNESYEMVTKELVSPIEQLFGQLDLAFIWVYLLPLIIILVSFNILSQERESGRIRLIASQPIHVSQWVLRKIVIRFLALLSCIILFTLILLVFFQVEVIQNIITFLQLVLLLLLYSAFWFFLSFIINLLGFSSGKSLILLTGIWVLLVFLIPSVVNQIGKEAHPIPSRLEIINHHQSMYNEMEKNMDEEMKQLFKAQPSWQSDDPVTKDLSNSTGWNIDFLAKQYMAQVKHQPKYEAYEDKIDLRNAWLNQFRFLSPAMILQKSLANIAGTSSHYYRGFLRQALEYAEDYRQYVFQGLFTNHAFTSEEIKNLPSFEFDDSRVPDMISSDFLVLLGYLTLLILGSFILVKSKTKLTLQKL